MPWFYVDDGFSDSKPVLNMPDRHRLAACGLWVLAGSWSAKEELDGFVPDSKLRQLGARPTILAALTEKGPMSAPLCERTSRGIQFNAWEKWQKTREELAEKRREDAERQRAWREAHPEAKVARKPKGRNAASSGDADTSQRDTTVTNNVTQADSQADSDGVSQRDLARTGARPDPTRPDPTLKELSSHLRDDPHVSNARDEPLPPEPPYDPTSEPDERAVDADAPTHVDNPPKPARRHPSSAAKTLVRHALGSDTIAAYPRTFLDRLATQVDKLLAEGHDDKHITAALIEWDTRPDAIPEHLPTVYGDVVKKLRATTNGNHVTPGEAKVLAWAALGEPTHPQPEAIER